MGRTVLPCLALRQNGLIDVPAYVASGIGAFGGILYALAGGGKQFFGLRNQTLQGRVQQGFPEMMSLRLEMSVAVICSLSAMGKTLMMRERVSGTERVCTVE